MSLMSNEVSNIVRGYHQIAGQRKNVIFSTEGYIEIIGLWCRTRLDQRAGVDITDHIYKGIW